MLKKTMILLITLLLAGCGAATSSNKTLSTNEVMRKLASYGIDVNHNIAYYCYNENMITQHYFYPEMNEDNVFIYTYDYDASNTLQQFQMEMPSGGDYLSAYVASANTNDQILYAGESIKISTIANAQDLLIQLDDFYDFSQAKMITTEFSDTSIHLVYSVGNKYIELNDQLQGNQIVYVEEKEYANEAMTDLTRISITTTTPPIYSQMVNQSNALVNANVAEAMHYNEFE